MMFTKGNSSTAPEIELTITFKAVTHDRTISDGTVNCLLSVIFFSLRKVLFSSKLQ